MGSHQHQQHNQTGEGENYTNTLTEHHVQSAIEMGLQSRQQTYQEFMDSFQFLSMEDVQKFNEAKLKKEMEKMSLGDEEESKEIGDVAKQQKPKEAVSKSENKLQSIKVADSEDDLETEELGEGTISRRCSDADKFGGGKKFVQVDNFVDDDPSSNCSSDEDDIIEYGRGGEGYVSSFGNVQDSTPGQTVQNEIKEKEQERTHQISGEYEENEEEERMISPLPGEAEDTYTDADNLGNIVHQTHLDICVKGTNNHMDVQSTHQEDSEESSNEVQPFTLDEAFDYDNVVLSKKWDFREQTPNLPS